VAGLFCGYFVLGFCFPLYFWLAVGGAGRGAALIAAGLGGILWLLATSRHGLDITYHNGIFRGMADFAIGVGMAVLYRARLSSGAKPLPTSMHSLAQIAVTAALFYAFYNTGWSHTRRDFWCFLPITALVWVLAFDRGVLARIMQTRPLQLLGGWSYAVYLGQTAWLQGIRIMEQHLYPPADTMIFGMRFADLIWWLEPVFLVLVCIGWGALLAALVEHPAARALRRYMDKPRTRWLT
jgi:peptidoglycan/LPS O-acetylase OafA/YrhL